MRLIEGRFLSDEDRAGKESVVVIGQSLASEIWGDASPIGRSFRIKFSPEPGRGFGPYTVVGVVADTKQSLMRPTPPQVFTAFYQQPLAANVFLHLKTRVSPERAAAAVSRIVSDMNPELALGSVSAMPELIDAEGLRPRLLARGLTMVAALAVTLAMGGLYAVSAW
ncbi:MAG TPA: ABC transporter permease, partial [Vicinamibacterales bacterium]|nr:ABC transporter permease [Vicinamibacterales bacterium]